MTGHAPSLDEAPPDGSAWWVRGVLSGGLITSITAVAIDQGGFYESGFTLAQWTILALTVVALGFCRPLRVWSTPVVVTLAFGGSALASGAVNGDVGAALPMTRLAAVAAGVAMLVAGMDRRHRTRVLYGLVFVGVVLAAIGIDAAARHEVPEAFFDRGRWRATATLWYPNALGAVLAPLGLASLARLVTEPRRVLWLMTTYGLLAGTMATWSRGALLGLGVGILILAMAFGPRRVVAVAWPVTIGLAVLAVALVPSVTGPAEAPLKVWMAFAGGAFVSGVIARSGARLRHAALATAIIVAVTTLTLGASRWGFGGDLDLASARDRLDTWKAGAGIVREQPVWGAGPGHVAYVYRKDVQPLFTRYAHNDYLDVAASQGLVGLAVVAAGAGAVARAVARHRSTLSLGAWVGGVAALSALGAQAAIDFPLRFPVVAMIAAVLAASVATPCPGAEPARARL